MTIDQYTDQEIVAALLARDTRVTKEYLYGKCFPLFYAVYSKYYTDCESPVELINEIYLDILMPKGNAAECKLEKFGFRCSLTMWLKIVAENYCRSLFAKKIDFSRDILTDSDRNDFESQSLDLNMKQLNVDDAHVILASMPNARYRELIRLKYLEEKSHDETAAALGMSMDNYYNKHRLAKQQLCAALKKEGLL